MNIYVHIKHSFIFCVESATGPLLSSENSLKLFSFFYVLGHETLPSSGRQSWGEQRERRRSKEPTAWAVVWGRVHVSAPSSWFLPECVGVLEKILLLRILSYMVPARLSGFWRKWSLHNPALALSSTLVQQRSVWHWSTRSPLLDS